MKAPQKISYSEDVDILMIQLSNKKIDDSYELDNGTIISVDKDGEPVLLEIFKGKQYLKQLGKSLPIKIVQEIISQSSAAIPHRIK